MRFTASSILASRATILAELPPNRRTRADVMGALSEPPLASTPQVRLYDSIDALLGAQTDVVVECAGYRAMMAFGELVLCQDPDLLVASVGALADRELEAGLHRAASASGGRLLIPVVPLAALTPSARRVRPA